MRGETRICPWCDETFEVGRWEHRNYAQRFCSRECAKADVTRRKRVNWPAETDMRRMVFHEKLSDAQIGARFGFSYEWARRIRNHYSIPALPKPPHREIKHGRYIDLAKWTVKNKGEDRCRACGSAAQGRGTLLGLHLHHVIPRSMCRATKVDLRNGIPLCVRCHQGWHDRSLVIYRDVFTAEEWAFLSAVQLTGQIVGPWLDANYPERPASLEAAA